MITPGFNYTGTPTISFIDACGKGHAATAIPVLGKVPTVILGALGPTDDGSYFLSWKSKNATSATTNFGSSELSGQTNVNPKEITTYSISVFDQTGLRADDSVTIVPGQFITEGDDTDADTTETFVLGEPADVGITTVIIVNPGFGYTFQNDGSVGGDGREWAAPDETIVRHYDPVGGPGFGTGPIDSDPRLVPSFGPGNRPDLYIYDQPYPPGFPIPLFPGDIIQTPPTSTPTTVVDNNGNDVVEVLPGVPTLIPVNSPGGSTTAPFKDPNNNLTVSFTQGSLPTLSDGQYPVSLKICSVTVQNPGRNYTKNDTVEVIPSNGAALKLIIGPFGTIAGVEVIKSGMGFSDYPEIRIKSETGYNAVLLPYLCVNNIGDLPDEERNALAQDGRILQVVDCVGKV